MHYVFSKEALKRIRSEQGLSQPRLSQLSGIPSQQVNAYERGRHVPGGQNIAKLARSLGCQFDDLLQPEVADQAAPGSADEVTSDDRARRSTRKGGGDV